MASNTNIFKDIIVFHSFISTYKESMFFVFKMVGENSNSDFIEPNC